MIAFITRLLYRLTQKHFVVQGDALKLFKKGEFDVLLHGANCFQTMGAGIARQIAKAHPEAVKADMATNFGTTHKLGSYSWAYVDRGPDMRPGIVVNVYTQYRPGPNFSLTALAQALPEIANQFDDHSFGYPQIGAGIGGGNWAEIYAIIRSAFYGRRHTLIIYKP